MTASEFLVREVPRFGRPLFRLGLSGSFGLDEAGCREALERIEYVFGPPDEGAHPRPARRAGTRPRPLRRRHRPDARLFPGVAAQGRRAGAADPGHRRDRRLSTLLAREDVGVHAGVQAEMAALRDEGRCGGSVCRSTTGARGATGRRLDPRCPDDPLQRRPPWRGAGVFPHLAARRPAVVSYTATAWRKLLAAPKGWTGRVPTAGDCYRFCLCSPHVDVALTGPRTVAQLRENLAAVERGPLTAEEDAWMRAVGRAVHG